MKVCVAPWRVVGGATTKLTSDIISSSNKVYFRLIVIIVIESSIMYAQGVLLSGRC